MSQRHRPRRSRTSAGWTLLELIMVLAIVGILAGIALPSLRHTPRRAQETVLKSDLRTLRDVIDQFKADNGNYPSTLDELVEKGYLRAIPRDPITKSSETWVVVYEDLNVDQELAETDLPEDGQPGIWDVHSGSELTSLDGEPYSEW